MVKWYIFSIENILLVKSFDIRCEKGKVFFITERVFSIFNQNLEHFSANVIEFIV